MKHLYFAAILALVCPSVSRAQLWEWTKDLHVTPQQSLNNGQYSNFVSAFDPAGNVLVCGRYHGFDSGSRFNGLPLPRGNGFFTAKLNAAGQTIWLNTQVLPDTPFVATPAKLRVHDIAADNQGGFYTIVDKNFTSRPGGGLLTRFELRHYDANGVITQQKEGNYWPYNTESQWSRIRLATDPGNNLFLGANAILPVVVGADTLANPGRPHMVVAKFGTQLQKNWSVYDSVNGSPQNNLMHSFTADRQGNVILCGSFRQATGFGFYNGIGTVITGSNNSNQLFIVKMNAQGQTQWIKGGTAVSQVSYSTCRDVATDSAGNIYAAGYFENVLTLDGIVTGSGIPTGGLTGTAMIMKLNSSGAAQWCRWAIGTPQNTTLTQQDVRLTVNKTGEATVFLPCKTLFTENGLQYLNPIRNALNYIRYDTGGLATRIISQPCDIQFYTFYNIGLNKLVSAPNGSIMHTGFITGYQIFDNDTTGYIIGSQTNQYGVIARLLRNTRTATGLVFHDQNQNGIPDPGEPGLPGVSVKATPGNTGVTSNNTGMYSLLFSGAATTIKVQVPQYWAQTLPAGGQGYTFPAYNNDTTYTNRDFGIYPLPNIKDLRISLIPLTAARPGFDVLYDVVYKNVGTVVQSGTVTVKLDSKYQLINSVPAATTVSGNTLTYSFTNLQLLEERKVRLRLNLSNTAPLNSFVTNTADINPVTGDSTPVNNFDTSRLLVRGSYDPNDKLVSKDSLTPAQLAATTLNYTIRFQNTGTDTAFKVVVRDTLPAGLLFSSIVDITASHPVQIVLNENNELECTFNNIQLPDKNHNEPASHGYVRFSIKPQTGLPVGTDIQNRAAIYFDFNTPVITEYTHTRVVEKINGPQPVSTQNDGKTIILKLVPHPVVNGQAGLQIQVPETGPMQFTLLNEKGELLQRFERTFTQTGLQTITLKLPVLNTGLYFLQAKQNSYKGVTSLLIQ